MSARTSSASTVLYYPTLYYIYYTVHNVGKNIERKYRPIERRGRASAAAKSNDYQYD